jgi:catechol 2,3-dioxygenase-like lactoylglutathione lyase family enzyme
MTDTAAVEGIITRSTRPAKLISGLSARQAHLAFAAPGKEFLDALADRLIAAGVNTKGVELFHGRWYYVAFRDPDNIQLEYWLNEPVGENEETT